MHLTQDNYESLGYAYVNDFLSQEEVTFLTQVMFKNREEKRLNNETDNRYYYKSEGGSPPEFRKVLEEKTPKIKELFKFNNAIPESVYARFYYNESTLNPHFDREALDHTLSVTLYSNLDEPWPLSCIDKKCNILSFDIKSGDGAMILGNKIVHWRKPLVCRSDQFVIQAFFHWRNIKK